MDVIDESLLLKENTLELRRSTKTILAENEKKKKNNCEESIGEHLDAEDHFSINIPNFQKNRASLLSRYFNNHNDCDQSAISALTFETGSQYNHYPLPIRGTHYHSGGIPNHRKKKQDTKGPLERFLDGSFCSPSVDHTEDTTWSCTNTFSQLGESMSFRTSSNNNEDEEETKSNVDGQRRQLSQKEDLGYSHYKKLSEDYELKRLEAKKLYGKRRRKKRSGNHKSKRSEEVTLNNGQTILLQYKSIRKDPNSNIESTINKKKTKGKKQKQITDNGVSSSTKKPKTPGKLLKRVRSAVRTTSNRTLSFVRSKTDPR